MTDFDRLLAAIRENPGEDAPRLVLADWLADAGRELEAIMQRIIAEPDRDEWRLDYAAELERTAGTVACGTCKGKPEIVKLPVSTETRLADGRIVREIQLPPFKPFGCTLCRGSGRVSDGRAELAAFIRVQVELANWKPYTPPPEIAEIAGGNRLYSMMAREQIINAQARHCGHHDHLRARERELWPAVRGAFEGEGAAKLFPVLGIDGIVGNAPLALIERGLPAVVRCTLAEWMGRKETLGGGEMRIGGQRVTMADATISTPGIGPRLAQRWPIERLEVADAIPVQVRDATQFYKEWRWFRKGDGVSSPSDLPHEIFDRLTGGTLNKGRWCRYFDTEAAARTALSDALIAWARGQCV